MRPRPSGTNANTGPVELTETVLDADPAPCTDAREVAWEGFDPPHRGSGPVFPVRKTLLKPPEVYQGIEAEGDRWMRLACDLARASVERGGGPFGAVVLQIDDESRRILRYWTGANGVVLSHDPTAHAEVSAIRAACASLAVFDLGIIRRGVSALPQPGETSHCVIYSSAEPCPMCYAAIRWAKLHRLCFAATRYDAAAPGVEFSDLALYEELAEPYARRAFPVRQCTVGNALDAFNLWKRSEKTPY